MSGAHLSDDAQALAAWREGVRLAMTTNAHRCEKCAPTYWLIQRVDGRETREPVGGDLGAARAAWLTAVNGGRSTYAVLVGLHKGRPVAWPCEWSAGAKTFQDLTDVHKAEMSALAARLTAEAPEGFSVTLRDEPGGWRVVFTGARTEHSLLGSASTIERVQAHWCGYAVRSAGR